MKSSVTKTTMARFCKDPELFLDAVCDNNEELVVRRREGRDVVVISLKEYNAIKETSYLLSTAANRKHLEKSIDDMQQGRVKKIDLKDLWK